MKEDVVKQNIILKYNNKSTRIFVIIMGILTGFGGLGHGISEIIQGNKPTVDILNRIGAFSIIPNYLITGILTVIISLIIIIWSIGYIHKKNGPIIYIVLSVILFFVGGGFAQVIGIISSLLMGLIFMILTIISGFGRDIKLNNKN